MRWIAVAGLLALVPVHGQEAPADWEWPSYAADLANTRYAPLDQIDGSNFNDLEVAWRLKTDNFGSQPEYRFESTPLMVGGVVYTTAGTRRAVVAVAADTGELLWMYRLDEGERGRVAPRRLSGRGLAYRDDGEAGQIFYVTPGYRLIALDAATGHRMPSFGTDGVVDLKQGMGQDIDALSGEVGLHATPIVAGNTIIVGSAHPPGGRQPSRRTVRGAVRGFDARTGERRWIFRTIPGADEFGNDTWLNESWRYTGNTVRQRTLAVSAARARPFDARGGDRVRVARELLAPHDVHGDADGNIWHTAHRSPYVGVLDPDTGVVTEHRIPDKAQATPGALPGTHRVWIDNEGLVWFSEGWASRLTALDPRSGQVVHRFDQRTPEGQRVFQANFAMDAEGYAYTTRIRRVASAGAAPGLRPRPTVRRATWCSSFRCGPSRRTTTTTS